MASIDDRIVAMKFDNQSFESRISQTIASLAQLQKSLDFSNSKKGFAEVSAAANGMNLSGIASAVDGIASKFSAMGVVAFTVLTNVANKAIDVGIQLAKSLSLDLVISGFQEYETNMNSIQTILSNTRQDATTLDQVNSALDTLNQYSDQTIYNFGEMARNIGTFTAAGVNLDTSVNAIKGIANLAAISGSNSQQASTAMYQLSQALASGSVKLMDWNSIVNAGMGGEVFQRALFETGKALGTIKDVPMDQSFDQWKDAGNSFRASLEEGWITAEVLTNTLSGFTGDLTEAQILSMGYTQEQAAEILELGKTGKAAATEVKTLTQLIGTVKESIGSGWSQSFRIVFGDFEEAKTLFTDINNVIGDFVGANADARNALLTGWKDLGGRTLLIDALKDAFSILSDVLGKVKRAFTDIFPPLTSERLFELTEQFHDFINELRPSYQTLSEIRRIFTGVFAALRIGIEIVQETFKFFGKLFQLFKGEGDTGLVSFAAKLGDGMVRLKEILVDSGGIEKAFDKIVEIVDFFRGGFTGEFTNEGEGILLFANKLGMALGSIGETISGFFDLLKGGGGSGGGLGDMEGLLNRITDRFDGLSGVTGVLSRAWDILISVGKKVGEIFGNIIQAIGDSFSDLPQVIADGLSETNYNQALDTLNTGLFGGLVLLVKKFIDGNGIFGNNGIMANISKSFEGLTGVLSAMQTQIKADALQKIAVALAILTASMVVLALIDSAALTKSMTALAIGMGQLVLAMALLNTITTGPMGALKLAGIAAGLTLLGGALLLLSFSVKILAGLSWEELARGLAGVTAILGVLSAAVIPLSSNSGGMIRAGLGILAISVALNILALAVKSFAEMNWADMGRGLTGAAASLTAIAVAMQLMPKNIAVRGAGLILIATALNILALAVKSFADMDWADMGKGMAGLAGSLLILAGALRLMPNGVSMALQGAGLLAIGIGLVSMAKAIKMLGGMSWGDMAKGIAGIAGTLIVLAGAAMLMQTSIGGAIAIGIMALSLSKLADGVKKFGSISWGELLKGIGGIALVLGALALSAVLIQPAIPALLGLGVALLLVGAGMALFGLGANLVATAFSIIATAGTQGIDTLAGALTMLIELLPEFIVAFGDGLIQLAGKLVEALPEIISGLGEVIAALLQVIIDNIPLLAETFLTFIMEILNVIKQATPELVATGLSMLLDLLKGIRDNIGEVTTTVIEIVLEFIGALASKAGDIIAAGLALLIALLEGIANNINMVITAAADIIAEFITGIGNGALLIIEAGSTMIANIIEGLGNAMTKITTAAADTIVAFLEGLDDNILKVVDAGWDFIINLIDGITDSIDDNMPRLREAGIKMAGAIINGMTGGLAEKAKDVAGSAIDVAKGAVGAVTGFLGINSPSKVFIGIGESMAEGLVYGLDHDTTAANSAEAFAQRVTGTLQTTLSQIPTILNNITDINPTITPVLDLSSVRSEAGKLGGLFGNVPIVAAASIRSAEVVAEADATRQEEVLTEPENRVPTEINFTQINNSPEALSTVDIYRRTRNQIVIAKEALSVL